MGQQSDHEYLPLEEQVKSLADDELLDFWEETQYLVRFLDVGGCPRQVEFNPEHERIILQELMVRSCRRSQG